MSSTEESEDKEKNNKDLSDIYNIFKDIYSKAPAVLKDLLNPSVDIDYKESINDHIDFKKINDKLQNEEYTSVPNVIKDIRLVFLNCYKFYGVNSEHTRKSLKVEQLLEQKISSLDENFQLLASTQLTFSLLNIEVKQNYKFRYPKNCYDSILLRAVAHCRPERLKEYHKILSNTLTTDEDKSHTLEEIVSWENEIFFNDNYQYISAMWELPEIGNFLAIIFKEFDLDVLNQGEIERMFLIPKESLSMSNVMTILLMPIKKTKHVGQLMPYKIWSEKLNKKVSEWYKVYHMKKRNKVNVVKMLGIHPDFWAVMGEKNPLDNCDYCELSYFMKVWLVKGLCDYITNKYKTINDIITNCMERQCTIWKNDLETEEYFFFNSMPDLRIYYHTIPDNEPSLEFLESEKLTEEVIEKDVLTASDTPSVFNSRARVKPNENNFKLIANSVQGLRSFLDELNFEDSSVPESLIQALEDFIIKIEPQEYNLIILENNSKIKLFKDWKTYTDRFLEEKEKTLFWEEKELKPLSEGLNEEVVLEKRKRKAVVKQGFDFNVKFDSDDLCSENEEYFSEYDDSEDEWGFINQSKSKTKLVIQAPSKLLELEKRLKEENKSSNHYKNKVYDHNENHKVSKIENKTLHNKKNKNNGCCNESIDLKSKINMEIEVSNDEEVVLMSNEKEKVLINDCEEQEKVIPIECKNNEIKTLYECKKQKFVVENNSYINISDAKKIKIDDSKNVNILAIDDKLNSSEILKDDDSRIFISNNSVSTNEQEDSISIKSTESDSNKNDEVIFIDDDDDIVNNEIIISDDDKKNNEIIISDDEDDVQFISVTPKPCSLPVKINRSYSLNNSLNKTHNFVPKKRQKITTDSSGSQVACTSIPKLSPNISIIPANVHLPKGIEVTMVKRPQSKISSHFNTLKRPVVKSNSNLKNNHSVVDVECKVISKPNLNGEVKFYVSLPNGKLHPVSDMLMNQYLKENNNILPDYWMVPLPVDVAKQYGFN